MPFIVIKIVMKREKENNKDFQNEVFCSLKFKPLIFFLEQSL